MMNLKMKLAQLFRHLKGQGMVEYALILGLVALILITVLRLIPQPVREIFQGVANALGETP